MFNFFKRKKKKEEKSEKKEQIIEKVEDVLSEEGSEDKVDNESKTNEEFNAFNEFNKHNEINETEKDDEKNISEKKADDITLEESSEENNHADEESHKLKAGRFIDLTKSEPSEDKKKIDNSGDNKFNFEEPVEAKDDIDTKEDIIIEESEEVSNKEIKKESMFERLKKGLSKTRDNFTSSLTNLFTRNVIIDDDLYDELEEILISADIGMSSTIEIVDKLREEIKKRSIKEADQIYPVLKEIMIEKLDEKNLDNEIKIENGKLTVILVIGVNGVGKTTTIGKLANNFKNEGKSVMLAAADTFRAAAIDQLKEWSDRACVDIISHKEGADPSAVIFDAIKSARSKNVDVLICDTAGRLHNKKNLMQELEKINRTIDTHAVNSNRENLLVLDATTGQNAVSQLREFKNVTDITGLILTKLDGTAKGGVIYPLQVEVEVPVKYIGVGEGIDHLQKFDSKSFVEAMF